MTEQHRVVIDVDYLGQPAVDRFLGDMQKAGALTGEAAKQIRDALNGGSIDSGAFARALGQATQGAVYFAAEARTVMSSVEGVRGAVSSLNSELRQFQQIMSQVQRGGMGGTGIDQVRAQAMRVLVQNAINQEMTYITRGGAPGGQQIIAARNPINVLPGGDGAAVVRARAQQEQGQLDFGAAAKAEVEATKRVTRVVTAVTAELNLAAQQMEAQARQVRAARVPPTQDALVEIIRRQQAFANIAAPVGQLALPAPPPGFVSSDALRAQRREARFAERSDLIGVSFGPGGNPMPRFGNDVESAAREFRTMQTKAQRLNAELDSALATFPGSAQKRNAFIADLNREALQSMAAQANQELRSGSGSADLIGGGSYADPRMGIGLAGELANLAAAVQGKGAPPNQAMRQLLYHGEANSTLLRGMSAELREYLTGQPEDPRHLGITTRYGAPVRGLYNQDTGLAAMQAADEGLQHKIRQADAAAQAVAARALPSGREFRQNVLADANARLAQSTSTEAAEVQRQVQLSQIVTRLLQQRVEAERAALGAVQGRWPEGTRFGAEAGFAYANHPTMGRIGELSWKGSGEISEIAVAPEMQRLGIATRMLAEAASAGFNLIHSNIRTDAGDAWARSVGGALPDRLTYPAGSSEKVESFLVESLRRSGQVTRAQQAAREQWLADQANLRSQGPGFDSASYPGLGRSRSAAAWAPADSGYRMVGWHGSVNPLPDQLLPLDQVRVANAQAYGRGLYTAQHYATSQEYALSANQADRSGIGYVYRMHAPKDARVFDLDQGVGEKDARAIVDALRQIGHPTTADSIASRFLPRAGAAGSGDLTDLLRADPWSDKATGGSWRAMYNYGDAVKEMVNDLIRLKGYDALQTRTQGMNSDGIYDTQQTWLNPERLRPSLAQYVFQDQAGYKMLPDGRVADYYGAPMPGQGLVPHPTQFNSQFPRFEELNRFGGSAGTYGPFANYEQLAAAAAAGGSGSGGRRPPPPLTGGPSPDGEDAERRRVKAAQDFAAKVEAEARAMEPGAADALLKAQLRLAQAERNLANVVEKATLGYSEEKGHKGYKDEDAAFRAYQAARATHLQATENLSKAQAAATAAPAGRTFGDPSQTGRFHGPFMPLQSDTQSAVQAALRQGGAMPQQSPLQAANQALTNAQANLAAATKAHQSVIGGQYKNQQQAAAAYAASLGTLTAAQQAHAKAQQQATIQAQVAQMNAMRAGFGAPAPSSGGTGGRSGSGGWFGGGGFGAGKTPGGGFFNDFSLGFHGRAEKSYAEQLGQAAKFSVLYGSAYKILFALTQTLQQTLQETILFEQAMTDLKIATGRSEEQLSDVARAVGQSSVAAGFAPSQGLEIAARAQGLYGVTGASAAEQDAVGRISAQVVSRLAVGSKKDPVALQADIAAIVQALGMDPTGQQRIADLDAYMTKKFGIQQGSTLQTVAQSASVGVAAGFSTEDLFAIAADMQSRTGQTDSAVAGFMAQIFSRGGEGSLVDVARRQGIDPNQELAVIIKQLAQVYQGAAPREQAEISAAFGRGKIQNAAVALLGDYEEVMARSAEAAAGGAQGVADTTFRERMNNLGGEIAVLSGLFKEFASSLGQSGMLDIVGATVMGLQELLESTNSILAVWNQLPDNFQRIAIASAILVAAIKSETVQRALSNRAGAYAFSRIPGAPTAMAAGPLGGQYLRTSGLALGPVSTQASAGARAMTALTAGASALINPMTLAISGFLAVGALASSASSMDQAMQSAADTLAAGAFLETAADYRNQAALLGTAADQNRHATGKFFNAVTFGLGDNENLAVAARMKAEAERLQAIATRMDAEEASARASAPTTIGFEGFGETDLKRGLDAIDQAGGTAATQFNALSAALYGTAAAAEAAAGAFDPKKFAENQASGLVGQMAMGLTDFLGGTTESGAFDPSAGAVGLKPGPGAAQKWGGLWRRLAPGPLGGLGSAFEQFGAFSSFFSSDEEKLSQLDEQTKNQLGNYLTGGRVEDRLTAGLASMGIDSKADIGGKKANQLAKIVGEGAAKAALAGTNASPEKIAELQAEIDAALAAYLLDQSKAARHLANPNAHLSASEAAAFSEQAVAASAGVKDSLPEGDLRGRVGQQRKLVALLQATRRRSDYSPGLNRDLDQARRDLAEDQFAELEAMRKRAQQNAKSKAEILRLGKSFINRAINMAVRNRSGDTLVAIIGQSGKASIAIAQEAINAAIRVAQAAMQEAQAIAQAAGYMGAQAATFVEDQIAFFKSIGMEVPQGLKDQRKGLRGGGYWQSEIDNLEGMKGQVGDAQYDPKNTAGKGLDSQNPNLDKWFPPEESAAERDTPAEIAAARAAAFANRSESQVGAARAAILSAKAGLAKAKKNTVEWWDLMGQLFAAQNQLTDALQAYQKNKMLLAIDMTNPLKVAQVETRAAAIKLREDIRSGAGKDVVAQDRVDLRSAQANQEATAFSQRLQSVQTAEQLGRISHSKYINYLENEKRRLEAVKHRTFQQQQQLDQVDGLLQDAAKTMQGQFNLGDIKLPTPYQVRRYIEQTSGAGTARMAASANASQTTNLNMYVDGADTAKVQQIVWTTLGKHARTRTIAARRR